MEVEILKQGHKPDNNFIGTCKKCSLKLKIPSEGVEEKDIHYWNNCDAVMLKCPNCHGDICATRKYRTINKWSWFK